MDRIAHSDDTSNRTIETLEECPGWRTKATEKSVTVIIAVGKDYRCEGLAARPDAKRRPDFGIEDTKPRTFRAELESKEFLGPACPSLKTVLAAMRTKQELGALKQVPIAQRRRERVQVNRAVDEHLALGGSITQCATKERKYVFSPEGARRADALRKRAKRGDKEAQEELTWWRHRALPKPYVPLRELACEPHSIRSNVPFDFEDRFLDRLGIREEANEGEHWGDVFLSGVGRYKANTYQSHDDNPDDTEGDDFTPSAAVHELVRPAYTNSLDRLVGHEVDHRRLHREGFKGAPRGLKKAWDAFEATWNDVLKQLRKDEIEEREQWHKTLV